VVRYPELITSTDVEAFLDAAEWDNAQARESATATRRAVGLSPDNETIVLDHQRTLAAA